MKIVNLKQRIIWTANKVKQDQIGIDIVDLKDHPEPQEYVEFRVGGRSLWLKQDFDSHSRNGRFYKQFPEGVLGITERCRFIPRGEQDYVYGYITDAFIRTKPNPEEGCDTLYDGIYKLTVTEDVHGFEWDLLPEDVELLDDSVDFPIGAGERVTVYRNQALRRGEVLVTYEQFALIEYEMPNGRIFQNAVNIYNRNQYVASVPKRVRDFYEMIYSC